MRAPAIGIAALVAAAGAVAAAAPVPARAQVATCVEVRAPEADREGVRRLVLSELARHPSHRLADRDCETRLEVEVFEAAGTRYLTARAATRSRCAMPSRTRATWSPAWSRRCRSPCTTSRRT